MDHYGLKYARDHWREVLDQVERTGQPLSLTYHGAPAVVLLPPPFWNQAVDLWKRLTDIDLSDAAQPLTLSSVRDGFLVLRDRAKAGEFIAITHYGRPLAIAVSSEWFTTIESSLNTIAELKNQRNKEKNT